MNKDQSKSTSELADAGKKSPVTKDDVKKFAGVVDGLTRGHISAMYLGSDDSPESTQAREILAAEMDALCNQVAGPKPCIIEQLLAERIATTSGLTSMFDYQAAWSLKRNNATSATYFFKQAERAENRLLRAIGALSQVRRVQGPMVQVNIAEKQVNIM